MEDLLALRIVVSIVGIVGNSVLMVSLLHSARLKPFEVFLLGLSVSNLEEIVVVDVYDGLLSRSSFRMSSWACRGLKFLTMFGEIGSILFTVLISVYRWQKLRVRVTLPGMMDGPGPARVLAVSCAALALLFASPTLLVNLDWSHSNSSAQACPVDFFQCTSSRCPTRNRVYKYSFLLLCNLLPLLVREHLCARYHLSPTPPMHRLALQENSPRLKAPHNQNTEHGTGSARLGPGPPSGVGTSVEEAGVWAVAALPL
ncbi:unnamed protein product [Leuciscus chuanchicus]